MDSFDLLPSLADGELAESSAPELVAAIFRSRASGTLTIEAPEAGEVRQFFRAGQMCGSAYFAGFHTLAQVLLEQEWAQALDVDASLAEAQAQGRRHGELLLEKGLLSQEQLTQALGAQHRGNLMALMRIERGHYEMRGWEPPPVWSRELNIDPLGPLFDSLEEPRLAHRRALVLDWLGASPVKLTPDWADMAPRALIGAADHRAIAQLSLARTRGEFLTVSRLMPARAEALLAGLLLIGGAEPKQNTAPISTGPRPVQPSVPPPRAPQPAAPSPRSPQASAPPPRPAQPSAPPRAAQPPPPPPRSVPPAPIPRAPVSPPRSAPPPDDVEIELVESISPPPPRARSHNPFEPMIDESALPEAVLASSPGVSKSRPGVVDEGEPLELDLSHKSFRGIQAVAPPHIQLDEEVLVAIGGPARAEPELEAPVRAMTSEEEIEIVPEAAPFATQTPNSASDDIRKKLRARGLRNMAGASRDVTEEAPQEVIPPAPPPKEEAAISREAQRFLDEVRARVRALPTQSPWQRLGVSNKATSEQIHAAYLEGVKRYHPDRASALGLTGVQDDLRALFAAIQEAHEKIGSTSAREKYAAQSTSSPGGASPRQEEATLALRMGEVLLKKRDFAAALVKLRRATELDANGDTLAALAWGLLCDPSTTPAQRSEAEMLIDRSLRVGGATARTHYVAGVAWRARDPSAAADAFRKALELDPNHRAASQEMRLLELRQQRKK